jgi:hypothetical protein
LAADGLIQDIAPPLAALYGDANLDGDFNSIDLVQVFRAGKYETSQAAAWSDGDFNLDGRFNSQDLIAALQRVETYSPHTFAAHAGVEEFNGTDELGAVAAMPSVAHALSNSHAQRLTSVAGEGEGIVNISPERNEPGFSAEIQVAVWKTSPNTTFSVKRAFDFNVDGVCSSDNFVQFPLPNSGPLVQLTTSEGGAGATHIKFERPQIADNTEFDVHFEVSTADASIILRTGCFTVSVE